MNIPSTQSGHWTDDELIASLYGVGLSGSHLDECAICRTRRVEMQRSREVVENVSAFEQQVRPDFLAAQRRAIYKRLDEPLRWWNAGGVRRLAAGVATAGVLAGSFFLYDQNRESKLAQERMADAQLAQQVAAMASDDSALPAMAPLQGLFEQ